MHHFVAWSDLLEPIYVGVEQHFPRDGKLLHPKRAFTLETIFHEYGQSVVRFLLGEDFGKDTPKAVDTALATVEAGFRMENFLFGSFGKHNYREPLYFSILRDDRWALEKPIFEKEEIAKMEDMEGVQYSFSGICPLKFKSMFK
eukprot:TRINITY_DN80977_c0_g1_i1.p1 TRINITY_DN80977_c0_g1~~TRINITY_DN80977_c0_g1_i1.p1  ORF type:complete len:154 (-),score=8.35 TRINITY_DN80977_c0_g1_i1:99-530(-)